MGTNLYAAFPLTRPKDIRLLEIDDVDSKISPDPPLVGRLSVVSLEDSPEYSALSYAWGDGTDRSADIICDRKILPISTSLHEALTELRWRYGKLRIWVDFICINQTDRIEKASQVRLMNELYSWAQTVYVWLGRGTPGTDAEMDALEVASAHIVCTRCIEWANDFHHTRARSMKAVFDHWRILKSFLHQTEESKKKRDLRGYLEGPLPHTLLSRSWFGRAWTFQEVILSRNPLIICGSKALTWEAFVCGMGYFSRNDDRSRARLEPFLQVASLWMAIPRKTHWNGVQIRHDLDGSNSMDSYQLRYGVLARKVRQLQVLFHYIPRLCMAGSVTAVFLYFAFSEQVTFRAQQAFVVPALFSALWSCFVLMSWYRQERGNRMRNREISRLHPWVYRPYGAILDRSPFTQPYGSHYRTSDTMPMSDDGKFTRSVSKTTLRNKSDVTQAVLRAIRDRYATDLRDKVYAIQGVLQEIGLPLSKIDYRESVAEIYANFYKSLLEWDQRLINLIIDAGMRRSSALAYAPTWVPHFDDAKRSQWLDESYIYAFHDSRVTSLYGSPSVTMQGYQLVLQGTIVDDKVIYISDPNACMEKGFPTGSSLRDATVDILKWVRVVRSEVNLADSSSSVPKILLSVILTTSEWRERESKDFDVWYAALKSCLRRVEGNQLRDFNPDCVQPLLSDHKVLKINVRYCNLLASQRRRLFVTTKGFIGSGNSCTEIGDELCLVGGVPVPLLLRGAGGKKLYNLVGPAYVHGMMGEEDEPQSVDNKVKEHEEIRIV